MRKFAHRTSKYGKKETFSRSSEIDDKEFSEQGERSGLRQLKYRCKCGNKCDGTLPGAVCGECFEKNLPKPVQQSTEEDLEL